METGKRYVSTWKVLSISVDIDFINDVHGRSCKKSGYVVQLLVDFLIDFFCIERYSINHFKVRDVKRLEMRNLSCIKNVHILQFKCHVFIISQ